MSVAEIKGASTCALHRDCRVLFDVPTGCPMCEVALTAVWEKAKLRGAANFLQREIARLKKREKEIPKLESRIFELEDRIADLTPECDEDGEPIKEPRPPEDLGARHGTEVSRRDWGEEAGL